MILFFEDWQKYPTARPDFNTTNTTWIELASLYKAMGVKNHAFHLALVNQRLAGIDPHREDLSLEIKGAIAQESLINPWYWFREVQKVPASSGRAAIGIRANRAIIATWWLFFNHITHMLIQPRQTGKSMSFEMLMVYLAQVAKMDSDMGGITRSEHLRVKTIARIKEANKCIPPYLNFITKKDSDNTFSFIVGARGNTFKLYLPSHSEKTADSLGRGFTMDTIWNDEGPFQSNSHITTPVLLATAIAAQEDAKEAGAHYGIIFTTTGGDRRTEEGAYFYNKKEAGAVWTEQFFDLENSTVLEDVIRKNSRGDTLRGDGVLFVDATFDHRQLGKSDKWAIDAQETTGATGDVLKMDIFCQWVAGSEGHPLSGELQEKIDKSLKSVTFCDISKDYGYAINWFIPKNAIKKEMKTCVICMDSSNISGGDYATLVFISSISGKVLGTGRYNRTSINMWSQWVFSVLVKYKKAVFMPENRSSGQGIIDIIVDMMLEVNMDPFTRIFNLIIHRKKSNPILYRQYEGAKRSMNTLRDFYYRNKAKFGYTTSGMGEMSRNALYGRLEEAAKNIGHLIHCEKLVNELLRLTKKNGRIDHGAKGNDDLVIAWLLGYWLITMGDNLNEYNLDPLQVLSQIPSEITGTIDQKEMAAKQYSDDLKRTIGDLKTRLMACKDPVVAMAIKRKIGVLLTKIPESYRLDYNMDQILENLKETSDRKQVAKMNSGRVPYGW